MKSIWPKQMFLFHFVIYIIEFVQRCVFLFHPITVPIYLSVYICIIVMTTCNCWKGGMRSYKIGVRVAWIEHFLVCVGRMWDCHRLRKSRITSGWAECNKHNQGEDQGVDCSDVSPGLLIEKTIIPNHGNNKEMLKTFRLVAWSEDCS